MLGGLAIAAGTVGAAFLFGERDSSTIVLVGSAIGGLALGLVDDRYPLGPDRQARRFACPWRGAGLPAQPVRDPRPPAPLVVLAVVWFAVVVHAVNLLDNMDGLAAGVGAITASGTAIILLAGRRAPARPS